MTNTITSIVNTPSDNISPRAMPTVLVTGTYQILYTDYLVVATANSFTITLPTAIGNTGRTYQIKNNGNGIISIATLLSQTIDGEIPANAISGGLSKGESISLASDGTNWIII